MLLEVDQVTGTGEHTFKWHSLDYWLEGAHLKSLQRRKGSQEWKIPPFQRKQCSKCWGKCFEYNALNTMLLSERKKKNANFKMSFYRMSNMGHASLACRKASRHGAHHHILALAMLAGANGNCSWSHYIGCPLLAWYDLMRQIMGGSASLIWSKGWRLPGPLLAGKKPTLFAAALDFTCNL